MRVGYIGLGSNQGNPAEQLRLAVESLREEVEVARVSSLYETEPVGEVLDQPNFLNAVAEITTDLEPEELLAVCKRIELDQGRDPKAPRHSPRPVDLDLLLLGDLEVQTDRLAIPHPELASRRFVLEPLLELDGGLRLPDGTDLAAESAALPQGEQRVTRVGSLG